MWNKTSAELNR